MAKVNNKTKGFNSITRDVVFDESISYQARFIYVYMACKPNDWEFFQDVMAKEIGIVKDTLRKYLDELIAAGWITEEKQQHIEKGKFGALQYTIEIEKKRNGKNPIRKNTDSEKYRNGKNPNHKDIDNNRNIDNEEIKKEKSISNDIPKKPIQARILTDDEERFYAHMEKDYPYVQKMKEPLTFEQYMRLHNEFEYSFEQIEDELARMDNYPNLHKCGRGAYRTALNWLKRDNKKESA